MTAVSYPTSSFLPHHILEMSEELFGLRIRVFSKLLQKYEYYLTVLQN